MRDRPVYCSKVYALKAGKGNARRGARTHSNVYLDEMCGVGDGVCARDPVRKRDIMCAYGVVEMNYKSIDF